MVPSRMFRSPAGTVLGVLLCLSCTWSVFSAASSENATVSTDLCYYGYCEEAGTCLNINGSPVCFCLEHLAGDRCQYLDACFVDGQCDPNHGHCSVTDSGTWQCDCKEGRTGWCYTESLEPSKCANVTCLNGGTCYHNSTTIDDTYCVCDDHHYGPFCENFSTCRGVYCHNGGTCNNDKGEAVCLCATGWRGPLCSISTRNDSCHGYWSPCWNGGLCVTDLEENVFCKCPEGFVGTICEYEDPCIDWTCKNGGTCSYVGALAYCHCDYSQWYGDHCEHHTTRCPDDVTCMNGGTCVYLGDGPRCLCLRGFTGTFCETKMPTPCDSSPCLNGGSCTDTGGSAFCDCDTEWYGDHCEYAFDCDRLGLCQNGGTCLTYFEGDDEPICDCSFGFTGTYCDEETSYQFAGLGLFSLIPIVLAGLALGGLSLALFIWKVNRLYKKTTPLLARSVSVHTLTI